MKKIRVFLVVAVMMFMGISSIGAAEFETLETNSAEENEEIEQSKELDVEINKDEDSVVSEEQVESNDKEDENQILDKFNEVDTFVNVQLNSIAELADAIQNAEDNDVLTLSDAFVEELANPATLVGLNVTLPDTFSKNITIDGNGKELIPAVGTLTIFTISNLGSGNIKFRNITVKQGNVAFVLRGNGDYTLENVKTDEMKSNAVLIYTEGSTVMNKCEFKNGGNTAVGTSGTSNITEVVINDTYFYNNKASYGHGGAILIFLNKTVTINRSTFEKNEVLSSGYTGGAIGVYPNSSNVTLNVEQSYFLENATANDIGGAIALTRLVDGNVKIHASFFEGNRTLGTSNVNDGAAIAIKNNAANVRANIEISDSTFLNNTANDNGGAMLIEAMNGGKTIASIYNNTFVGNRANNSSSGVGGAIQTYGAADTTISHNTFYKNENAKTAGGGAIGLSGGRSASDPNWYGSAVVANNIFVDNKNGTTAASNTKHNVATALLVPVQAINNGNVGYDNGTKFIPDDDARNSLVKAENIFTEFYGAGDVLLYGASVGDAKPIQFKSLAGSLGHQQTPFSYVPSPRIDEMLRTGDPRTVTGILSDVRGYPREQLTLGNPYFPNAGAIEIYWTKFDTGAGSWSSRFDVEAEDGLESLAYPGQFYKMSNPPTMDASGNPAYESNFTFTRNTLVGPAGYGFVGWKDIASDEIKDVNEEYFSRKQTYIAEWRGDTYHIDFDLIGGSAGVGNENDFTTQVIINGQNDNLGTQPNSVPLKEGYVFAGWYEDDTYVGDEWNFATNAVNQDTTLYAKWVAAYTVNFDTQGGNTIDSIFGLAEGSKIVAPQVPIREGYTFEGWYTGLGFETIWNFESDVVTNNMTLYSKWSLDDVVKPEEPGKPSEPPKDKTTAPQTGDTQDKNLYQFVLVVAGIYGLYYLRKSKKKV